MARKELLTLLCWATGIVKIISWCYSYLWGRNQLRDIGRKTYILYSDHFLWVAIDLGLNVYIYGESIRLVLKHEPRSLV